MDHDNSKEWRWSNLAYVLLDDIFDDDSIAESSWITNMQISSQALKS
jgi:hypothetical protein